MPSPSLAGRALVLAGHAAALVSLPFTHLPSWGLFVLAAALCWSAWRGLRPSPWARLVATSDGSWQLIGHDGCVHRAELRGGGLRHPWLVTLPFGLDEGGRWTVALFADALPAAEHKALRRWLAVAGEVSAAGR